MTVAATLLKLLENHGVDTVFGLPGVHTVELYRSLPDVKIRHVTPRHEQGAGFMADGYARSSGRPGVCLLITGPGVTNAATAIAQSYADSVPVLVISSVNPVVKNGRGEGRLHELPDQQGLMDKITAFSETITSAEQLPRAIARAFDVFDSKRPRPVHIEIPTDVMPMPGPSADAVVGPTPAPMPDEADLDAVAKRLMDAKRPVVIAGGGAVDAAESIQQLVESTDAVFHHTIAAKGVLPADHPLNAGCVLGFDAARAQIQDADLILVAGSELAPTDLWPHDELVVTGNVVRIDIEARQFQFAPIPDVALHAKVSDAVQGINLRLANFPGVDKKGAARAQAIRETFEFDPVFQTWLDALRDVMPADTIFSADSTQIVYVGNASFPMSTPRSWLTSVTGYGTLGYALPAAIGARLANPDRRVVCIAGDGGFQFTSQELMTASQLDIDIDILIWNNSGYGEIRDSMNRQGVEPAGVDVAAPDFALFAASCAVQSHQVRHSSELASVLADPPRGPRLVELLV